MTTTPGSLWLSSAGRAEPPGHRGASDAQAAALERLGGRQVVVVGAGLAGLATALRMHDHGVDVAVVEAGGIAERTTGHSTAKVTALQSTVYSSITKSSGIEVARTYAEANLGGLAALRHAVERLGIECGLTDATAITCVMSSAEVHRIEAEAEAAAAAGLPVDVGNGTDLPFPVAATVSLAEQAHVDPVRLCQGIADHLLAAGVPVIEHTPVLEVSEDSSGCTLRFADDRVISVGKVVQATHLPITDPSLLAGRVSPEQSYVIAGTSPVPIAGMYYAVDEGWSIRPASGPAAEAADGSGAVLLVGGEGHSMVDQSGSEQRYTQLEAWAARSVGLAATHRWSAHDYSPADHVPFIGRLAPGSHHRFVITGFRKWGMAMSFAAAELLTAAVTGQQHHLAETFDSTRLRRTVTSKAAVHNAKVAKRFIADRLTGQTERLEPGQGGVYRVDGRRLAVSVDSGGVLRAVDATCTHMKCIVGFNSGDQTWDCPCHASRFSLDGAVIDGPAVSPLENVELTDESTSTIHSGDRAE